MPAPEPEGEAMALAKNYAHWTGDIGDLARAYLALAEENKRLVAMRDKFLAALSCEQIQHGRMGPAFDAAMAAKPQDIHVLQEHEWIGSLSSDAYCGKCGRDYRDGSASACKGTGQPIRAALRPESGA